MFDPSKLKVGDVFYSVKERNQAFNRKKIYQDIDDYRWFRYDRPLRTYEVVTHTILGMIRKELEGEWPQGEMCELETGYNVRSLDETHMRTGEFYFEKQDYFVDKQEALDYIKILEAQAKELDET
jgi:hypothetical protein